MTTFYVATLSRYVLVEADDEASARVAGRVALEPLHAELGGQLGREVPIDIRVVRLATEDEIDFWRWNEETTARESAGR